MKKAKEEKSMHCLFDACSKTACQRNNVRISRFERKQALNVLHRSAQISETLSSIRTTIECLCVSRTQIENCVTFQKSLFYLYCIFKKEYKINVPEDASCSADLQSSSFR